MKENKGFWHKFPVDYSGFKLNMINEKEFRHLKLLFFWPLYGIAFYMLERLPILGSFHVMHHWIDDMIPFLEFFVIPYVFWYFYLFWIHIYTLLYDVRAFKKFMYFIIIAVSINLLIFIIYPSCQNLRPETFERDNWMTALIGYLYSIDTNTNVFPSLHVVSSMAVMYGALSTERFKKKGWVITLIIITMLINISTVFVKQHSFLDMIGGIVLSLIVIVFLEFCIYRKKT